MTTLLPAQVPTVSSQQSSRDCSRLSSQQFLPPVSQRSPQSSSPQPQQASGQILEQPPQQIACESVQQSSEMPQVYKSRRSGRRISWAPADQLCQIRLFVEEDAPIMSGAVQDQLQAKQVRNLHAFNSVAPLGTQDLPPGFGAFAVKSKADAPALAAVTPQILWKMPSVVSLDPIWNVLAGGSSMETSTQKRREVRVLEALYPRPSSIPDSPAEPLDLQEPYDDGVTLQIPLVPLEEEDLADGSDLSGLSLGPRMVSRGSFSEVGGVQFSSISAGIRNGRPEKLKQFMGYGLPQGLVHENMSPREESAQRNSSPLFRGRSVLKDNFSDLFGGRPPIGSLPFDVHVANRDSVKQDAAAEAGAALAAFSRSSSEMGSMIDSELLIQILSNPSLLQSLTSTKLHFVPPKSDPTPSVDLSATRRELEETDQAMVPTGGASVLARINSWNPPLPSIPFEIVPVGGQDGNRPRVGELYSSGSERLKTISSLPSLPLVIVPAGVQDGNRSRVGELYSSEGERHHVGSAARSSAFMLAAMRKRERLTGSGSARGPGVLFRSASGPPPGFGNGGGNTEARVRAPPGFGGDSASQHGPQMVSSKVGAVLPTRTLSLLDEQYFKSLIMQHGCKSADDDDHGRAPMDIQGGGGWRINSRGLAPEVKRRYGKDEEEAARVVRDERDSREGERNVAGSGVDTQSKSRKPCTYFGTSRGCRNGASCIYEHNLSDPERPGVERAERSRNEPYNHLPRVKRLKS